MNQSFQLQYRLAEVVSISYSKLSAEMFFKNMLIVLFTVFTLYNSVFTRHDTNLTYGLIKPTNKNISRKSFRENMKKHKRSGGTRPVQNYKMAFFLWLLILSGDVELNPGPTCATCQQQFNRPSRLQNHQTTASPVACDVCQKMFCHRSTMEQHKVRIHTGAGIGNNETTNNADLNTPILPPTGHHQTVEYQTAINEHRATIRSQTNIGSEWKNINKEIPPTFTYRDLKLLLDEVRNGENGAFKINLGFGSML